MTSEQLREIEENLLPELKRCANNLTGPYSDSLRISELLSIFTSAVAMDDSRAALAKLLSEVRRLRHLTFECECYVAGSEPVIELRDGRKPCKYALAEKE